MSADVQIALMDAVRLSRQHQISQARSLRVLLRHSDENIREAFRFWMSQENQR